MSRRLREDLIASGAIVPAGAATRDPPWVSRMKFLPIDDAGRAAVSKPHPEPARWSRERREEQW